MPSFSSDSSHENNKKQPEQTQSRRKRPLATLLVEQGFFESLDEARRWIMAGHVLVNNQCLDKPGMPVASNAHIRIRGRSRYASRAGYKLEAALQHFALDVTGQVILDCGASTGGFTDCLLQYGASQVYAVDVGHDQLINRLQINPRVHNLERTNLSNLTLAQLPPAPSLITLDLSYLSLTIALPIATALLAPEGQILTLVKPLFEVEGNQARRTGSIDDPHLLITALQQVIQAGIACGLTFQGLAKLALQPRHGVHEYIASFIRHGNTIPHSPFDDQTLLTIIDGPGIGRTLPE